MKWLLLRSKEKKTIGLAITNYTTDQRFFLFEIDLNSKDLIEEIKDVYRLFGLDLLIHRTGNGWHFLSVTLLSKEVWREARDKLKHINVDCPMITLRLEPNKYIQEDSVWYLFEWFNFNHNRPNSVECVNKLNSIWPIPFSEAGIYANTTVHTDLKIVNYPLPKIIDDGHGYNF